MEMPLSERKQIENEMIFRRMNEKVGLDLDALDLQNVSENNPDLARSSDYELDFKCECSDESCDERLAIKMSEYNKIHKNRSAFVIKPEHQVESIEEVISKEAEYYVVEKNNTTPEPDDTLNTTSVNNV